MNKTVIAIAVLTMAAHARADNEPIGAGRLASAARVVQDMRSSMPQEYWDKAHCVVVIPDLKKAAFIIGGEYGSGVMSCRSADRWSPPVFVELAKGSWGFQVGAEQLDVVMLVMNESGVQKLLDNKITLGADASVAAGPIGRQGHVGTDGALTAEIIAYSRAKGLFAGIDLSGGVLRPDEDANRSTYGSPASPRSILARREIAAPPEAMPFLSALNATSTPQQTVQTAARPSVSGPAPTTDSDLRARLVDMQQTLERMLGDADRRPVGTSGSAGANVITIDRAQLEELRRELDAAFRALGAR